MSSAKRRINSTGRKRITHDRVEIRMNNPEPGAALSATAAVRLDDLGFPASAGVVINAYHRSTGMRFDCGTVGDLRIPPLLVLDEIDRDGAVLFRIKVVDRVSSPGKLLGAAERISPREADNPDGKRSIFPVIQRDLGEVVWKVVFPDGSRPTLILNSRIPGITQRIKGNHLARGVLLPAAMKIVLQRLVADPSSDEADENDWRSEWNQFTRENLHLVEDLDALARMSPVELTDWVDDAVQAFGAQSGFVDSIRAIADLEQPHV
ncbi:MAG: hypothetical protein AB7F09_18070 [Parvibaculaceae bacterium]